MPAEWAACEVQAVTWVTPQWNLSGYGHIEPHREKLHEVSQILYWNDRLMFTLLKKHWHWRPGHQRRRSISNSLSHCLKMWKEKASSSTFYLLLFFLCCRFRIAYKRRQFWRFRLLGEAVKSFWLTARPTNRGLSGRLTWTLCLDHVLLQKTWTDVQNLLTEYMRTNVSFQWILFLLSLRAFLKHGPRWEL